MAILRSFALAIDLLANGTVDVQPLLSPPLTLADFGEALNRARRGHGIKTHVRPA